MVVNVAVGLFGCGRQRYPAARTRAYRMQAEQQVDPRNYRVADVTRQAVPLCVRAIRSEDKEALHRAFNELSERSRYFRFMGFKRDLTVSDLAHLTELDFVEHVALVATLSDDGVERIVGVGRYVRDRDRSLAEIAFAVPDHYHGQGIGTVLLHHLATIARAHGINRFEADVLGDNRPMLQMLADSGLDLKESFDGGIVHVLLDTTNPDKSRDS